MSTNNSESNTTSRQFSLRHIKHETKLNNSLYSMLLDQNLVDVIISCDGNNIRAHRLILSANSSYFKTLFDSLESNRCQIPIIVLKDVPLVDLKAIVEFMYRGEVCVEEKQLSSVLKSAELLKVFGLTEVCLALRSRLNNERLEVNKSLPSGPTPQKRPRINEGIRPTPQTSSDVLFSKLSTARFEIRPNSQQNITAITTSSSKSNAQPLQTSVSTGLTANTPSLVKNVILPSSQIHRKSDSTKASQIVTTNTNKNIVQTFKPMSDKSLAKSPTVTLSTKVGPNTTPTTCTAKLSANNQISISRRFLTSTWTPSQQTVSQTSTNVTSSLQNPISSPQNPTSSPQNLTTKSPIEVLIDDETVDTSKDNEDDIDIKPPIFELNEGLRLDKEVTLSDIESETFQKDFQTNSSEIKLKSKELSKSETKAHPFRKLRTPSTSSQPLPPPPSYRVVQRSSSRLLRNIIKPATALSSSSTTVSKGKETDEKSKLNAKKERHSVRIIRQRCTEPGSNINPSSGDSPEIECPSCGQKFNDEKKWNEHIASHLPFQT